MWQLTIGDPVMVWFIPRHNPVFAGSFLVPFSFIEHLASERVSHAFLCPSQFTFLLFREILFPGPVL